MGRATLLAGLFATALERWFGWFPSLGRGESEDERQQSASREVPASHNAPPVRKPRAERNPEKREPSRLRASLADVPEPRILIFAVLSLAGLGLLMAYAAYSSETGTPEVAEFHLNRIVLHGSRRSADARSLPRVARGVRRAVVPLLVVTMALLVAARFPASGTSPSANLADDRLADVRPAELAKVVFVVCAARFLATQKVRVEAKLRTPRGLLCSHSAPGCGLRVEPSAPWSS